MFIIHYYFVTIYIDIHIITLANETIETRTFNFTNHMVSSFNKDTVNTQDTGFISEKKLVCPFNEKSVKNPKAKESTQSEDLGMADRL